VRSSLEYALTIGAQLRIKVSARSRQSKAELSVSPLVIIGNDEKIKLDAAGSQM
jgi:hypothetical protein